MPIPSPQMAHSRDQRGACPGLHWGVIDERRGGDDERAGIDSSDEDETSSVEASVGSNSPVGEEEERRGRAAALRNASGPSSKSSTARTEGAVEKGAGLWTIRLGRKKVKEEMRWNRRQEGGYSKRRTSMSLLTAAEEERCSLPPALDIDYPAW
ncbi:unnamed protein product [Tuber aestivum]|uniref:Uncharacterized protein n=1 Tax=Tuber aestivum TaxID=59557 RepID=A0A292PXQ5_9PEZI|nr:unnamed protein product [Tuber aestivum]